MVEKWGGCHAPCDLRHWGLRPFGGVYVGWVVIGWVQGVGVWQGGRYKHTWKGLSVLRQSWPNSANSAHHQVAATLLDHQCASNNGLGAAGQETKVTSSKTLR